MIKNKLKKKWRGNKSTRRLIGAKTFSEYGTETFERGEVVLFKVQPANLSVLSPENIETKIRYLTTALSAIPEMEMACIDSSERFDKNKQYLKEQYEKEQNPKIRELLLKDNAFLDEIQLETATAREFLIIVRYRNLTTQQVFAGLNRVEKTLRDQNFEVRRCDKDEMKRILAIYFEQNITSDVLPDEDGAQYIDDGLDTPK